MFFHSMLSSPRFLIFVIFIVAFIIWLLVKKGEKECSDRYNSVDAVVPAYNEEVTIGKTVNDLLENKFIRRVIVVDDGSTDQTVRIIQQLQQIYANRISLISQLNTGKAGALNKGIHYVETEMVFLTDADIRIPNNDGLGYLIKAIENGADAVAGIPGSDLNNISFSGKVRASIKIFFATFRKCGGEIIGGHPFCVSGSVGMYRVDVLRKVMFPDRTCVEDLDLTWELIARGYKIAQSAKAIVYSQEAACFADDIKRWKRWISGYAVCMRIHKGLLLSRFGLTVILPNFLIGLFGAVFMVIPFIIDFKSAFIGLIIWLITLIFASSYSASKQGKKWWLIFYSPFSILIILLIFYCWIIWGIPSLVTGNEKKWTKVKRY
ncbi:cellulose synthase/poly-beta-1,6-N-acetylglucosamine synthase-like glycosyltransferase [Anaerosolibacter carboniphilus]|uniref:Cellulose synthase/poly-beta-1,6-N-acetylglucosamine synthase-like glycosyltransferase n=1 Tax=Anaerosolibacter carboniphilus TaxID=1417629 RepID=A0A841KWW9_9FIRM|nr:glycosyltransferase family 2 protein [Anaerosolibacter carboniphilus]MBB6217863.1 cellulose synthase/poly-beta-1,6-N-acetylglucosamine synthase-like glycosyltransferase [Anaerosolibacter carboniphilus]